MDPIGFKNKKVVVTGGLGFLGTHLVKTLLNLKAEVHVLDITEDHNQEDIKYHQINLNNKKALNECMSELHPDIIYHLAASLNRTRDFTETNSILKTNLNGTVNLLNAIKDIPYQKLIYASTSEIYGGNAIEAPFKETDHFVPASPYALSKYCAEMAIQTFSEINAKHYTIVRLFNFFGKGLPTHFFISELVEKLKANSDFNMTHGAQKRDFLYIEDVIKALVLVESKKANQNTFNVCSGSGMSIKDVALELKAMLHSTSKINFGAIPYRDNEVWNMTGDNSKLKNTLSWQPTYTFKQGLEDYLNLTL